MRRARAWIVLLLAVLVAAGASFALALPPLVRWAALKGVRSATGREVTIGAVEVSVFSGRLVVADLRIDDHAGNPPLAALERLEARFRVLPLLLGRLRLDAVSIAAPRLHLVREPSGQLNIADILERFGKGEPSKAPMDVVLTRLDLERGAVTLDDRAVTPARSWRLDGLTLAMHDIATRGDAGRGTVSAKLILAGAPLTLEAREIRVKPARAKATVTLIGLDLAPFWTYIGGDPPVRPDGGRFSTRLEIDHAAPSGTRAGGEVTIERLALFRRGQAEAFVSTPALRLTSRDVVYKDGAITAARLEVMGDPTVVDGSVSPAQRFDLSGVHVIVEDASYPTRTPARVTLTAGLPAGGAVDVGGTAELHPLAANLDVALRNVDLKLVRPYLPATAPVTVGAGRLGTALKMGYAANGTLWLSGTASAAQLALMRKGQTEPFVTCPLLQTTLVDAVLQDHALSVRRVTLSGAPAIVDASVTPPRRLALRGLAVEAADLVWPPGPGSRVRVTAELPEAGTLAVDGTVALATRAIDLTVGVNNAELAPYAAWLPVDAPLAGRAQASLALRGDLGGESPKVGVRGAMTAEKLALGPAPTPPLSIDRVAVTGIDVRWPERVAIARILVTKPWALLEREQDGTFPLRTMLTPRAANRGPAASTRSPAPSAAEGPTSPASRPPMAIEIGEIVVEEGDTRFVDRTTTPFFSEEISRLAVSLRAVKNAPAARADMALQAVVGPRGALELKGQVTLGQPFYLDVAGELRDIAMSQANPYMRFYSGWIARGGSVTTKLHYRIVGEELDASNVVHVQQIRVERAAEADSGVTKRVGLPLGLIVAMITDSRGDIDFNVPVTGNLNAPGFSFGDAIWAAVKNVLVNVAAAPFRAIGKLFRGSDEAPAEQFQVDPVTFAAGSADVTTDARRQLQRVADFLRGSPYVKIAIEPVASADDVLSLKTQETVVRIQTVQREQRLPDFASAATAIFRQTYPQAPVPKSPEEIVAALREAAPVPDELGRRLAVRRAEAVRQTLVDEAGIEAERLDVRPAAVNVQDTGRGRVQFELLP